MVVVYVYLLCVYVYLSFYVASMFVQREKQ